MNDWSQSKDQHFGPGYPSGYPNDPQFRVNKKSKWLAGLLAFFIPGTGHFYLGQMTKGLGIMLLIALDICAIVFAQTRMDNLLIVVFLSLLLPIIYFYSLFDAVQSTDAVNDRRSYPGWQGAAMPGAHMPTYSGFPPQPFAEPFQGTPMSERAGPTAHAGPQPEPHAPYPPEPQPSAPGLPRHVNSSGIVVLAIVAGVVILAIGKGMSSWIFHSTGSVAGSIVLIAVGAGLLIWEKRNDRGRKG